MATMSERFDEVVAIMTRLRGDGGCPWDRKQTRETLKPFLIEEAYEVLETIDAQDDRKLKEELGDVLLQILFHAEIGRERKTFTMDDVLETLAQKLIRRHPHVFSEASTNPAPSAEEVLTRWEEIKSQEKVAESGSEKVSALDGVPKILPALIRAYQLQGRAARVGFDWPEGDAGYQQILEKIHEELQEVEVARQAVVVGAPDSTLHCLENEVGDLLFAAVNLARHLKVNPEEALRGTANRFAARFRHMETAAIDQGRQLSDLTLMEQDTLWEAAKAAERQGSER
jgi:tetrapyrrole methylase family protein / MazG family protein